MSEVIRKACNQNEAYDLLDWGVRTVKAVPGCMLSDGR